MASPKVKFKTNIPIVMRFPFGDGKEFKSQLYDKPEYLYTVEIDNEKHSLFASEKLHEMLLAADGFGKGAVVQIAKVEAEKGNHKDWEVEVLTPGTAPAPRTAQAAPQAPASPPAPQSAPNGHSASQAPQRTANARLTFNRAADNMAEMWEACFQRAQVMLARSYAGEVPVDTIVAVAATLFINTTRMGYAGVDETPGLAALRAMVDRLYSDPKYALVRESHELHPLPPTADAQRALYAKLRAAIETVDKLAPDEAPAPASPPARAEDPADMHPPEPEGGFGFDQPAAAPAAESTKPYDAATGEVLVTDGKRARIEILAREAFGTGAEAAESLSIFLTEAVGREIRAVAEIPDLEALNVIAALKRQIDGAAA